MITVKVDATSALARFGKSGIPDDVRRNLRALIPDLTRRLASRVDANLTAGLRTRRRLQVKSAMVENRQGITGRVTVVSTSEPLMLPLWLESGTRAHAIETLLIVLVVAIILFYVVIPILHMIGGMNLYLPTSGR